MCCLRGAGGEESSGTRGAKGPAPCRARGGRKTGSGWQALVGGFGPACCWIPPSGCSLGAAYRDMSRCVPWHPGAGEGSRSRPVPSPPGMSPCPRGGTGAAFRKGTPTLTHGLLGVQSGSWRGSGPVLGFTQYCGERESRAGGEGGAEPWDKEPRAQEAKCPQHRPQHAQQLKAKARIRLPRGLGGSRRRDPPASTRARFHPSKPPAP